MFVVIGTTTVDLFVLSPDAAPGQAADGFRADNLVFTSEPLCLSMGGNGGNSACVLVGLGAPTALCSAVGRDLLGDILAEWLSARGVALDGLIRSPTYATSTSVIIMADAASQKVYHHLGATAAIAANAIPERLLTGVDVLLITGLPLMAGLRTEGGAAQVLAMAHSTGAITALDVGPALGSPVTLAELAPMLRQIDYLIANEHELSALGIGDDWEAASVRLIDAGARHVLIKRGRRGVTLRSQNMCIDAPAFPVRAVVSVGAGDSFNAGFLYAVQQGWSQARALRFGAATAALVIAGEGGTLAAPTLAEVEKFLETEEIGD
jgi:sugar/nucleoside kinase (ribokinase family)